MTENLDLFDYEIQNDDRPRTPALQSAYLVTNNKNLLYMLSAGLVLSSDCLGDKYYLDTLACSPGWIPLFLRTPSKAALNYSTTESSYLVPCIVEISLCDLAGPVQVLSKGELKQQTLPLIEGTVELIYVPAPIPLSSVVGVLCRTAEDKKTILSDMKNYGNVSDVGLKFSTEKKRFTSRSKAKWPPTSAPESRKTSHAVVQAAGGMLALLRIMANRCVSKPESSHECWGTAVHTVAFDPGSDMESRSLPTLEDSILYGISSWMEAGRSVQKTNVTDTRSLILRSLFWRTIDRMIENGITQSKSQVHDILAEYVLEAKDEMPTAIINKVSELLKDLKSLMGLGDIRISEMLEKYQSSFARAFLIYVLREDSSALVEFSEPGFTDEDLLAAAVLFGTQDGYIALPTNLRGNAAAVLATSHQMALLSHRMQNSGLYFGKPPARPKPAVEFFLRDWNDSIQEIALRIATKNRWKCIQTHIRIGLGNYQVNLHRDGMEIVINDQPKTVQTVVDKRIFLSFLAEAIRRNPGSETQYLKELTNSEAGS